MDRLDAAETTASGMIFQTQLRDARFPEDAVLAPQPEIQPGQSLALFGLVNEPCFEKATGPDPNRFGLWLDKRISSPDCPPDPFENETKYPGVKIGARGKTVPVGSFYGYATGIVGLRLFPNPCLRRRSRQEMGPQALLRRSDLLPFKGSGEAIPRRHVLWLLSRRAGFQQTPRKIRSIPEWKHLSSNVGAQYFWVDRIFSWEADESSFPYQFSTRLAPARSIPH